MGRIGTGITEWALQPSDAPCASGDPASSVRADDLGYEATKRTLDRLLAALLLLLLAPVMFAAAVAVKCTSAGPVLFCQRRAGRNGRPFVMYKFRSMVREADGLRPHLVEQNESQGPVFKLRHDPRLTRVGRLLRRTSIDELPQLFNVLRGEMSLVGPRPLPLDEVRVSTSAERRRLSVRPGLTCLWQISGRCEIPYDEWMQLDLLYIEHRGLALDLEILLRTIPAVLSGRGAY